MRIPVHSAFTPSSRLAFTLVELMVAMVASLALAGTAFILVVDTAYEQRNGLADSSVETSAYTLEAKVTSCLRAMSANAGMTPAGASAVFDGGGNLLGYQSIFVFSPSNGAYVTANISYNPSTGQVIYIPNMTAPSNQTVWATSNKSSALTQFVFNPSANMDGSYNSSLVNVSFQMSDNGFSQQNPSNNPASIYRNFSVQMRNDY